MFVLMNSRLASKLGHSGSKTRSSALTYTEGQTGEGMCAVERSYPKVGVGQILKWHLEYFSSYEHFSKLKRSSNMGLNDKV